MAVVFLLKIFISYVLAVKAPAILGYWYGRQIIYPKLFPLKYWYQTIDFDPMRTLVQSIDSRMIFTRPTEQ